MRSAYGAFFSLAAGGLVLTGCANAPSPQFPTTAEPPPVVAQPATPPPSAPPQSAQHLIPLKSLAGWADEDHVAALEAFQHGCGVARAVLWREVCARARRQVDLDEDAARAFFEDNFRADFTPTTGLLTAYFAPEYPAREAADEVFSAPVRPKPEDGAAPDPDTADPAARQDAHGGGDAVTSLDRAGIEAETAQDALAYMRPEDLFFLQIQGSGVLVFPDGRRLKAVYAGDNGKPFVGIARPMMEAGLLTQNHASGDAIRAWLADHRGAEAQAMMDKDPRYVFFTLAPDDDKDPQGAAGVALPAGRALAVDPAYHAYGELYWIDAAAPTIAGAAKTYRRLAIALDKGSAIHGDIRADLYLGRGGGAGAEAGRVRHTLLLVRLVPVPDRREAVGGREANPKG